MKYVDFCPQWADQLMTGDARALSPTDYLMLKEHILNCPQCMKAHHRYLGIEAQLRNLPLLQPQRQLSTQLLREVEAQKAKRPLFDVQIWPETAQQKSVATLKTYSGRLKNLVAIVRRPGYAFMAFLFCLLTTVASAGAITYVSHSNTLQNARAIYYATHNNKVPQNLPPHLTASTYYLALSIVYLPYQASYSMKMHKNFLKAVATFTLKNTGNQLLMWNLDSAQSAVSPEYDTVLFSAQPSHGVLKGSEYSPVQIIASGISYDNVASNAPVTLARLIFTSNGGDVALQTTLKQPTTVEPAISSVPPLSFSKEGKPLTPSMRADYMLRRQNL